MSLKCYACDWIWWALFVRNVKAETENLLSRKLQNNHLKCWSPLFIALFLSSQNAHYFAVSFFSPFIIYLIPGVKYLLWRLHCLHYMGMKSVECFSSEKYSNKLNATLGWRTFLRFDYTNTTKSTVVLLSTQSPRFLFLFGRSFVEIQNWIHMSNEISNIYLAFISLTNAHASFTMNSYFPIWHFAECLKLNSWIFQRIIKYLCSGF